MTRSYTHIPDLESIIEIPKDGILSRTVYSDASVNVTLFGFDTGQELSEHTSARPALLQIMRGEARLTLGGDAMDARPGTWVHMPAGLAHRIEAVTPLVMQLVLLPPAPEKPA
jgi:quercetin dioxygenase-like cupin family protein